MLRALANYTQTLSDVNIEKSTQNSLSWSKIMKLREVKLILDNLFSKVYQSLINIQGLYNTEHFCIHAGLNGNNRTLVSVQWKALMKNIGTIKHFIRLWTFTEKGKPKVFNEYIVYTIHPRNHSKSQVITKVQTPIEKKHCISIL